MLLLVGKVQIRPKPGVKIAKFTINSVVNTPKYHDMVIDYE